MIQPENLGELTARPNVQVIKRLYDAFARRDVAEVMSLFDPEIEVSQSAELTYGGTYKGIPSATEFFMKLTQTITSTPALENFIDSGEHVVAIGRTTGVVNANGNAFDMPIAHVWEVQNGKVVRVGFYVHNPVMIAALGTEFDGQR